MNSTAPTCGTCDRPADGTAYACQHCANRARAHLRTIASLAGPAGPARDVAHGRVRRGPATGGKGAASRLPLNLAAGARLDAVTNTVTTWARHVAEERGTAIPAAGDPLTIAAKLLSAHIDWLRHQPEAAEAIRDLATAARVLTALVDGPADRRWLGQCGADTDAGTCDIDLHARLTATTATCRGCGARHDVRQRRTWLAEVARSYAYTAREIEQAYGVRAGTIRVWAHRGRLAAAGEVDGRPVYPLAAVLDLADQDAQRKREGHAARAS